MRALLAHDYGTVDDLRFESIADPAPADGEVVVRVAAVGLNPLDLKMLGGELRALFETRFPYVPGVDVAGTVVAAGANVNGFAVGDRVGGALHAGLAELVRAPAATPMIAKIPPELDAAEAAASPVVGVAALEALDAAGPLAGKTVAVVGATGAVGGIIVQRAAAAGGRVLATAAAADAAAIRGLGASETIDHTTGSVKDVLGRLAPSGTDVLFDLVNVGEALGAMAAFVRSGGRLVSTLFGPRSADLGGRIEVAYVRMDEGGTVTVGQLYDALVRGDVRITIGKRYPFAQAVEALRALRAGHVRGKILVNF